MDGREEGREGVVIQEQVITVSWTGGRGLGVVVCSQWCAHFLLMSSLVKSVSFDKPAGMEPLRFWFSFKPKILSAQPHGRNKARF